MKYWFKDEKNASGYPATLMRYDEPANSPSGPGNYDNAHYDLWCLAMRYREALIAALRAQTESEAYDLIRTALNSSENKVPAFGLE